MDMEITRALTEITVVKEYAIAGAPPVSADIKAGSERQILPTRVALEWRNGRLTLINLSGRYVLKSGRVSDDRYRIYGVYADDTFTGPLAWLQDLIDTETSTL